MMRLSFAFAKISHLSSESQAENETEIFDIFTTDDNVILFAEEHSENYQHQQHNDDKVNEQRELAPQRREREVVRNRLRASRRRTAILYTLAPRINIPGAAWGILKSSAGLRGHRQHVLGKPKHIKQMIVTLLRKFRVADNPRKFALYECSYESDEETPTLLSKSNNKDRYR
ncbi:unnamed protein product [Strongylus vulgaris]|uniref:Ras-associating domain-containing protein n=1 Tax=Strongylus vulgaris TaxID=40348 RepID=A0A3P7IP80_STRVU|nr:unnamed protein product [Strongylus vulgaris]